MTDLRYATGGYLGYKNATAEQALVNRRGTYDRTEADSRKTANQDGTGRRALYAVVGDKDLDVHKGEIAYGIIDRNIDNIQDTVLALTSVNGVGDLGNDRSARAKELAKAEFLDKIFFAGIAMKPIEYQLGEHGTTDNEFALQIGGTVSIKARGGALATGHYVMMAMPDDEALPGNLRHENGRPLSKRTLVPKQVQHTDYFQQFLAKLKNPSPRPDRKKPNPSIGEAYFSQAVMNYLVIQAMLLQAGAVPVDMNAAFGLFGFNADMPMDAAFAQQVANALANPAGAFGVNAVGAVRGDTAEGRALSEFSRIQEELVTSVAEEFDAFQRRIFGRVIIGCEKDGVADIQLI